jgi:hypothetical protein
MKRLLQTSPRKPIPSNRGCGAERPTPYCCVTGNPGSPLPLLLSPSTSRFLDTMVEHMCAVSDFYTDPSPTSSNPSFHLKLRAIEVLPSCNIFDLQPYHGEVLLWLKVTTSTDLCKEEHIFVVTSMLEHIQDTPRFFAKRCWAPLSIFGVYSWSDGSCSLDGLGTRRKKGCG